MAHAFVGFWRRAGALVLVVLIAFGTQGLSGTKTSAANPPAKGPIKIGFIVPLTGAAAAAGHAMSDGFNLYLDQCHSQMGGRAVKFIVENDDCNPATGVQMVHKLVEQDKVHLLSGQYLANVLYKVAPVADSLGVPLVDCVSGADDITQRKRMKWVIRTSWTSSSPTHPFGEYAAKTMHIKKVVTIASDYAYGYEVVGGFQQSFEANGGQIVQKLWAPIGFTDFSELMKQIHPDADAVFMCIVGQSAKIVAKQYHDLGPKLPLIGATTSFDESVLSVVGEDLLGGTSCNPWSLALDRPENKKFVADFRVKYHKDPGWEAECGYTNAMWIKTAVDAVKGNVEDKESLMAALRNVQLEDAPRGPMKLDPYGMVQENIYIRKVQKVGDKIENVVIFTYPMVSQFWTWNPDVYMKQPAYSKEYPTCTHCK